MKKILFIILIYFAFQGTYAQNKSKKHLTENIPMVTLEWGNVKNKGNNEFTSQFILKNTSSKTLTSNWTIYFNQIFPIIKTSPEVIIKHVNGDLYKIYPSEKYKNIAGGKVLKIDIVSSLKAISISDAPQGPFIVFYNSKKEKISQTNVPYTILPFDTKNLKRSADDNFPAADAQWNFEQNKIIKPIAKSDVPTILPTPYSIKKNGEVVAFSFPKTVHTSDEFLETARLLQEEWKKQSKNVSIDNLTDAKEGIIFEKNINLSAEEYKLEISENNLVKISAADSRGIFYGIQSLKALLQNNYNGKNIEKQLIIDKPRYAYRGMHLDVGRNFLPKEWVIKLLDQMAYYKINTFHFHLTDDEGWRLEIPSLPELTQIGSKRNFTDENGMLPSFGSGENQNSSGSGHYTVEDFVEILNYAKKHHITVIPEIDGPGHMRAAIKSMKYRYDRLMKEGKKQEAEEYLLQELQDKSQYESVQGWNDNVINPCLPSVYHFFEKVTDDLIAIYKKAGLFPSTIHIGGDEVPNGVWGKSSLCSSVPEKDRKNILFGQFITKVSDILAKKNIKTAGWEEVALKNVNGKAEINNDINKENVYPYIWNNIWGSDLQDISYRLANAGFSVILCNVTNLYFDLAYEKNPTEVGYYWGGFVNTKKIYEFTPDNILNSAYHDHLGNPISDENKKKFVSLTDEGKKNIFGLQAELWSENVTSTKIADYMTFPKLLAFAEKAWAPEKEWEDISDESTRIAKLQKDWNTFVNQIRYYEFPRLEREKIEFRIPSAGAIISDGKIYVNTAYPNLEVYYTTDNTEPNEKSNIYTQPISFEKTKKYLFKTKFNGRWGKTIKLD